MHLKLPWHNMCVSHKIVTIVYFMIILIKQQKIKIVLNICLALTGSTKHKSKINKCLATAPALPYSKSVYKSQISKCVCKSQNVCPYVYVSHKEANVCVSHKILIHQVLPRGLDKEGWQWSAMVLFGAWRITCKEITSKPGLKQLKQNSKVFCDLHTFLAWLTHECNIFSIAYICLIGNFENIFCFAISVYFLCTNLFIWREKIPHTGYTTVWV